MQEFAIRKASRCAGAMHQLTCLKSRKAVRIMKLISILLLGTCLQLSARGISQTISLSLKDVSLQKVFKEIERQTDFTFFVEMDVITNAKKITISVSNLPLNQVLDLCFKDQPFTYSFSGTIIVVSQKKKDKALAEGQIPAGKNPIDVRGRVIDANGDPVLGATVSIQGSSKRTITNANGEFIIPEVDDKAVVVISHVQYETMTVSLKGSGVVTATLQLKVSSLDELQVIAYGTTTKRFNTGNISSIKSEDIEKQPVNNPLLALQGRVPGLFVTQTSGVSGGAIRVRVQGQNSINRGNDPFYVVDGVPYPSQLSSTGVDNILSDVSTGARGNPLSYMSPSDIESIEVLKDADATAIYGSRAANGAILITTKKGKAGQNKVDLNFQQGWGKLIDKMDVLNTRQYLDMRYEAFQNDGINWKANSVVAEDLKVWDTTAYTDWQKVLIGGTAKYTNITTSLSGGTSNFQYLVGGSYNRQTTVFPTSLADTKIGVHFNINTNSINQKLRLQLSANYLVDNNYLPGADLTAKALLTAPNAPALYDTDGNINWAPNSAGNSTWTNPLVDIVHSTYSNKTRNLIANAMISYSLLPGLEVKSSLGYVNLLTDDFNGFPILAFKPEDRSLVQREAYYGRRNMYTWSVEPQVSYKKNLLKGKLEGLIGFSIQQNNNNVESFVGTGYNSDQVLKDIKSAASVSVNLSSVSLYKYAALFGRLNYNWQNKYIVNAAWRRDGSSRFGSKNQFHNFGSVGAAWIFSEEQFFKSLLSVLSFGKLKASYGTTGNDQIPDYIFLSLYNITSAGIPYQSTTGLATNNISNPYIQWEDTKKLQMGLEVGLIKERVFLNATYSRNRSSNQLLAYPLPLITGFPNVTDNLPATVQNKSWEFSISSDNVKGKQFVWKTNINLTIPENKLLSFPNLSSSTYANTLVVGEPVNVIKALHFLGVNESNGQYMFADKNGNAISSPGSIEDLSVLIKTFPKYYGGLQNTLQYKGFQLDVLFQFVKQIGKPLVFYNGVTGPGSLFVGFSNQPTTVLNRWRKPGDVATIRKYGSDFFSLDAQMTAVNGSDESYADASYVRLKNLSLSWQMPERFQKSLHMHSCMIYTQCQNLITFTNFIGMDPENQSNSSLPPLKMISIGLKLSL